MKNTITIIAAVALFIIFSLVIYFGVGISSVYTPLKKYEYYGSIKQLMQKIDLYISNNHEVSIKPGDTVGNNSNGYAYYYTIQMNVEKNNIEYDVRFENKTSSDFNNTQISLIGAHDYGNKIGGYRINDNGVKNLVYTFDNNFISRLNEKQNTGIKAMSK